MTRPEPAKQARRKPVFFRAPAELKKWFDANHASARELWVGYFKKGTGRPSVSWPESVDEALCVGWIDGIRKNLDEESYVIRFTPRRAGSIWSAINIRRVDALAREKRMRPSGLEAFAARRENKVGIYSYEQRPADLVEPYRGIFRKNKKAWAYFEAQPPGYRKIATWWIVCAKKEETRRKRLKQLIALSAAARRLPGLERRRPSK
jgi:uncharacterized protein YdeI (YjbR/CyaY-like superfamily)